MNDEDIEIYKKRLQTSLETMSATMHKALDDLEKDIELMRDQINGVDEAGKGEQ